MINFVSALLSAFRSVSVRGDHEANEIGHDDSPIVIDDNGWCTGHRLSVRKSPRSNSLATKQPIGVCWHWTATGPGTAWNIAKSWTKLPGPDQHVGSAHFIIGRTGFIIQTVSCLRGSWHAGYGKRFEVDEKWVSANRVFIGVELENVGEVRQVDGKWMGWPFGRDGRKGPVVPDRDVVSASGRHYHAFTVEQADAARRLAHALAGEYPIDRRNAEWGHVDIDPDRKSDPGPVWKWVLPKILDDVYGPR